MRIAFVVAGLDAGGAEKIVNVLAHHRSRNGDTVHVLALNAADDRSFFAYDAAVRVEPLTPRNRSASLATAARLKALRRRLKSFRPDVVVSFLTKVNVLTALASAGLPHTLVASERNNFLQQPLHPLWRAVFPRVMRRASFMVMQTGRAAASLPPALRDKAVVVPNFVTPPPATAPSGRPLRLIATGRLDRQKGFDLLVRAFALVCRQVDDLPLVVYGSGPERDSLIALAAELGIGDRVVLAGASVRPGGWASPGDIFVLSSRYEGFPNVLLEALAAGMATVSFDCPWGPGEIIGTSGAAMLVEPENTGALASAIVEVARDRALRQRLAASGPRLAAAFSQEAVLAQWDGILDGAVRTSADTRHRDAPLDKHPDQSGIRLSKRCFPT